MYKYKTIYKEIYKYLFYMDMKKEEYKNDLCDKIIIDF